MQSFLTTNTWKIYFSPAVSRSFIKVWVRGKKIINLFHDRIAPVSTPTPDETILGILAAKPQHGYQLLEHFNQRQSLGRVWSMSTSQVYAVLKRLENAGLVRGETVDVPDAPSRTIYTITPAGEARLEAWLYDPQPSPNIRRVRIEFLSKLYIAQLLELPVAEIIHYQREACSQHKKFIMEPSNNGNHVMDRMVTRFILGQLDAAIAWLDQCENQISEGR
jgi:DNA-binding PadR family transcriptional regulator